MRRSFGTEVEEALAGKKKRKKKKKRKTGSLGVTRKKKKKRVNTRLNPFTEEELEKKAKKLARQIGTKYKIEGISALQTTEDVECISTGFQEIDDAITGEIDDRMNRIPGTGKGFPRGRIIEIFGPEAAAKTTLALCVIAQAQKYGEMCAFVDAEQALDPVYATKVLGVNMRALLFHQPDSGDDALKFVEACVMEKVSVIVVDSVSALSSKSELEGGRALGEQARLMSKVCRKLTAKLRPGGPLVIFINQIRYKIGVVFGCFQYNTRVRLADGSTEKIGKIVNQRLPVEVLSVADNGIVEPRKVVDWYDNGKAEYFLQFVTESSLGGNGAFQFAVTPNHLIKTPHGFERVEDLKPGDVVMGLSKTVYSLLQKQVLFGSTLGDGNIRPTGEHKAQMRIKHGPKQEEYAQWKAELFDGKIAGYEIDINGWGFITKSSVWLRKLHRKAYTSHGRILPFISMVNGFDLLVDNLTELAVAIWYMDDGSFSGSFKRWGKGKTSISFRSYYECECQTMAFALEAAGYPLPTVTKNKQLLWSGDRSYEFQSRIAKYIPESMQYKLHPNLRDLFDASWLEDLSGGEGYATIPVRIQDIYEKPATKSMQKFDLQVEGNHTYIADGVVVHNSPEVTSGGNALKFYSSIRGIVRKKQTLKRTFSGEGVKEIGDRIRFRVVKNKVSPPFGEVIFDIKYNKGISIPVIRKRKKRKKK